jgi:ParB family chromosome partitioning protein
MNSLLESVVLRASKLAGVREVPCLIKTGEDNDLMKLEFAIIENVQREDLNPVDRARSFQRLVDEFGFKHSKSAKKSAKVENMFQIAYVCFHCQQIF